MSLKGALTGNYGSQKSQNIHKTKYAYDPAMAEQGGLLRQMIGQFQAGGDFGFGDYARSMQGTLGQGMARRGISPSSGVYQSALGNMLAQAGAQAGQNRMQYGLGLVQADPNLRLRQKWGFSKGKQSGFSFGGSIGLGG